MNTTTRISKVEHLAYWLGRGWRSYVRGEQRLSGWLVAQGVSPAVATILRWTFNLVALGMLLYAAFWLALLLIFAVVAAWAAANTSTEEDEWPFTDLNELRKTPGYDPNLYNDTSHELYTDD